MNVSPGYIGSNIHMNDPLHPEVFIKRPREITRLDLHDLCIDAIGLCVFVSVFAVISVVIVMHL